MIDWNVEETQPPPCNPEIFSRGIVVAVLCQGSGRMWHVQALIDEVSRVSETVGQTDWSYFAGRAVVKTLGPAERVAAALADVWPQFIAKFSDADMDRQLP